MPATTSFPARSRVNPVTAIFTDRTETPGATVLLPDTGARRPASVAAENATAARNDASNVDPTVWREALSTPSHGDLVAAFEAGLAAFEAAVNG